jgi:hypothetical protein
VSRVREDSELRDFWEDAGDSDHWLADVGGLLETVQRRRSARDLCLSATPG